MPDPMEQINYCKSSEGNPVMLPLHQHYAHSTKNFLYKICGLSRVMYNFVKKMKFSGTTQRFGVGALPVHDSPSNQRGAESFERGILLLGQSSLTMLVYEHYEPAIFKVNELVLRSFL